MIVSGLNTYHNLFAFSANSGDQEAHKYVYPPQKIEFDNESDKHGVASISFYFDHSVVVFKNGQIAAIGNNSEGQLGPFFDHLIYNKIIYGHGFVGTLFISAVCGAWYTLYMHTNENKDPPRATICFSEDDDQRNFLYYDVSTLLSDTKFVPAAIFGGNEKSAIIDEKGNVIIISKELTNIDFNLRSSFNSSSNLLSPPSKVRCEYLYFPRSFFSEKAISVACCNNFTVVLTKSGKVYGNGKINQENGRHINETDKNKNINDRNSLIEIEELKGHNIVQISGTFQHVLAVSSEGRVFGVGSNYNGQLGIGPNKKNIWRFEEINNIYPKYRIINTSSGSGHSIFISEAGEVLTCGNNGYHQLFEEDHEDNKDEETIKKGIHFYAKEIIIPKEMKGRATFSIAGNCLSGLFINTEPPPNQPNTVLKSNRPYIMPELSLNDMYKHARNEMARLHFQIETMSHYEVEYNKKKQKCNSDENFFNGIIHNQSSEILNLNDEIEEISKSIAWLENENDSLISQIDEYNKNHHIDDGEFIDLKNHDEKQFLLNLGIDFDQNKNNINFIDDDMIGELNLNEIQSNDSRFNSFVFEKEKLFSIIELKKNNNSDYGEQLKSFFNEYMKLSSLDHPNIVKTVGFIKGDSKKGAGIVQEYFPEEMTKENIKNKNFSNKEIEIIFKEIVEAIKYLKEHQIFKIKMKPRNISIENNKHIKIHLQPQIQNQNVNENDNEEDNNYKEYEIFLKQENQEKTNQNDQEMIEKEQVYSIGIFIIYLFNETQKQKQQPQQKQPEEESKSPKEIQTILKQLEIPTKLNELLNQMTSTNSQKRPTLSKIESELEFES